MPDNYLSHLGVGHLDNPPGRGSGRFGYGTGENPGQHQYTFKSEVERFRKKGLKDKEIAVALLGEGATASDLRAELAIQRTNERRMKVARARELMIECNGNRSEVGRRMGVGESQIRKWLDEDIERNQDKYLNTADYMKDKIDNLGIIDVGPGTEISMNVTNNTMKNAIYLLEKEGYIKAKCEIPGRSTDKKTTITVLCPPDTEYRIGPDGSKYINWTQNTINPITDYSPDEGKTFDTLKYPSSLDSSRIAIRYKEEGGADKDGVIEIRRGLNDVNLGGAQYAQVRIAVDDTHYLKGMALYSDDLPKGVDVLINSNKKMGTPLIDQHTHELLLKGKMRPEDYDSDHGVAKPMKTVESTGKIDQNNPFGAAIKRGGQSFYEDKNGNYIKKGDVFLEAKKSDKGERYSLSPVNKLSEEGDWDSWAKRLSTQFLSKQPLKLINQQIKLSVDEKRSELADIMKLTNPVIKQKLLKSFADACESNANDLSVRGFKDQAFQVILPVPNMKDNEIYAPRFKDGDTVALVRYPHGGTFEIPILKVNNSHNPEATKFMKNAYDAVGITPNTASILSGADFDGDTALVIPLASNKLSIVATKPFDELKNFDTKSYALPDSAPPVKNKTKQQQMGITTNLITDMTAQGAPPDKIVRAVRHSMVVIDSEKHHLDYKQSAIDNKIQELKNEYQNGGGASTIFSRSNAKSNYIPQIKETVDKKKMTPAEIKAFEAGKKIYRPTGKTKNKTVEITDPSVMKPDELKLYKAGKKVIRYTDEKELVQVKVKGMAAATIAGKDAYSLVYDANDPKERAYANYANELIRLGDEARKEMRAIKPVKVSQEAKITYKEEVDQLNRDLRLAKANQPKERIAKSIAATRASERIKSSPGLDYEHKSRIRTQELDKARAELGAHRHMIEITDREWDAIQANAISTSKLKEILENTDQEAFKKRATPRDSNVNLSNEKINLMKSMYSTGMYTQREIAERLGVSTSLVSQTVRG